jgi:hypothetical protein
VPQNVEKCITLNLGNEEKEGGERQGTKKEFGWTEEGRKRTKEREREREN